MSISVYAQKLTCKHCGKPHGTAQWPANGDLTPFYFQREPGNHTLAVRCPHCSKDWYVVWDADPGPIEPLTGVARHETLGEAMARTGTSATDVLRSWTEPGRQGTPVAAKPETSSVVRFSCPSCGRGVRAPLQAAGKQMLCPACNQQIKIPAAPAAPAPPQLAQAQQALLRFACPLCKRALKVSTSLRGKQVLCPGCKKNIAVPESEPPAKKVPTPGAAVVRPGTIQCTFRRKKFEFISGPDHGVFQIVWPGGEDFALGLELDWWKKAGEEGILERLRLELALKQIELTDAQLSDLRAFVGKTFAGGEILCDVCGGSGNCSCVPRYSDRVTESYRRGKEADERMNELKVRQPDLYWRTERPRVCDKCEDFCTCPTCKGKGKY